MLYYIANKSGYRISIILKYKNQETFQNCDPDITHMQLAGEDLCGERRGVGAIIKVC